MVRTARLLGCWLVVLAYAVGTMRADEPVDRLIVQLQQPQLGGRIDAAKQLARLGSDAGAATDALISALGDSQSDMRLVAAYALGCIGSDSPRVLAALVPVLTDRDEHVRYSAQWSVAHIASKIQSDIEATTAGQLAAVLEKAVKEMRPREHQPRHLVAVELALSRVEQLMPPKIITLVAPAPVPEPPLPTLPAIEPSVEQQNAAKMAESMYAASDLLGQFLFVKRLADLQAYSDDLRVMVLEKESREHDTTILDFAMKSWGARGQILLVELFQRRVESDMLVAEDESLIRALVPNSPELCQQIVTLATDSQQPYEIRWSALDAIRHAPSIDPESLDALLAMLQDENVDIDLRNAVVETMADLGPLAAACEPRLIALLRDTSDQSMRGTLARALVAIAPTSQASVASVHELLKSTTTELPLFIDLADVCGSFGLAASDCTQDLLKGLADTDAYTRIRTVEALGRMGAGLGQNAQTTAQAIVSLITNPQEEINVKNAAAHTLKSMGVPGVEALLVKLNDESASTPAAKLDVPARLEIPNLELSPESNSEGAKIPVAGEVSTQQPSVMADVLRALAIVGPQASLAQSRCLSILKDTKLEADTRAAAAAALGSICSNAGGSLGRDYSEVSTTLARLCAPDHDDSLRSACILALASINPTEASTEIEKLTNEESILLRASAAYATHLTGKSTVAFEALVDLIDGSETDDVIANAIADMGPVTAPWLQQVAEDRDRLEPARLICYRLACEQENPNWESLLPLVGDPELGAEFTICAEGMVQTDEGLRVMLELLGNQRLRPSAHARITTMLAPDGLGEGGDEQDWEGLTLQQPSMVSSLAARASAQAQKPAAAVEMEPATNQPSESAMPGGESSGQSSSTPANPSRKRSPEPAMPVQSVPIAAAPLPGQPTIVDVFFGTNRGRVAPNAAQHDLNMNVLATAGGGMLAMVLCLIALVRSGNRTLALVALLALGIAAPFGYRAAERFTHESLHGQVTYDGSYRSQVELGVCQVSIPPNHQPGELESPQLFKLEYKQELDKHVVLTGVEQLPKDKFFTGLRQTLDTKGKNILVFIHGYNVSFDDAARRTAQMAHDLKFPGAPVFYSWPSQANWYGYATDRENIELSVNQIKSFLLDLAEKSGAETINLVAHSMGNVGLTGALREIDNSSLHKPMFNQVVLAAPDIDADIFKERIAPQIVSRARHVTLYTSQTDLALIASRYFNHGPRIGDSANGVPLFPGIETVDATSVDSSLIGHSYYGSNVTVLTDLGFLLNNQPASSRQYLQTVPSVPQPHWTFDPTRISQNLAPGATR